jgi:hypothetical protein
MTVIFETITFPTGETAEYAIIAHEDGSFTSMLKSAYDTLPSNSSIPQAGE